MICATKPTTTHHGRRSCRRWLAHRPAVLLGSVYLEQQPHRWQVDHHTATAAR